MALIGRVHGIDRSQGYGHIITDGPEYYFHKSQVKRVNFNDLSDGDIVEFIASSHSFDEDEVGEDRRAANVRPASPEAIAEFKANEASSQKAE